MAPGASAVKVAAAARRPAARSAARSTVSVADKVALLYERNDLRVREELETLARNEAPGIGADTVSPVGTAGQRRPAVRRLALRTLSACSAAAGRRSDAWEARSR